MTQRAPASTSTLRSTEAQLKAVLDTAVDAIITIDERGVIQSVNPATIRIFGYDETEVIGRNVSMLMPPPYQHEHDGYLAQYLATGQKRIIGIGREVQARRKDGTIFPIDLAVSEVHAGKLFTGIVRDISDRKLAESRVREADRLASIGTLAAGLGHDMNNVLLPLKGHLNAIRASMAPDPDQTVQFDRIEKSVKYLQQLADGLHYLAMDPDQDDERAEATQLHHWWAQTGALLRKAVPRHVTVTETIPHDLPRVAVAAHSLAQAMLNLIVNAGEAIPTTKANCDGRVHVWASMADHPGFVRIGVTDNGIGMDENTERRAFDIFFTTKSRGLGTGLGLALVRRIVKRVRGSIELDTAVGKGTTITLLMPIAVEPNETAAAAASVISMPDGRAATMLANLVRLAGFPDAELSEEPANAPLWIVEPSSARLVTAKAWRRRMPRGRLILYGSPSKNGVAWRALDPEIIHDRESIAAARKAIQSAAVG